MSPRLPSSAYTLLFYSCLWSLGWTSRRLNSCWQMTPDDIRNNTPTSLMPSVLHFQTWSRDPQNPVVMNYAWSTVGYPTLFLSQSHGENGCTNKTFHTNLEEFLANQTYGSVHVAGSDSDGAVAIVFRRLIGFNGGKKAKASSIFNTSDTYDSVNLDNDTIQWYYDPNRRSITGVGGHLFGSLTLSFVLPDREEDERISYFPKTKYTLNSTVVDVILENFNFSAVGKNGRVAIEMVMLNGQEVNESSTRQATSLDDEYTPSVFRTWEYYFNNENQAYLQWKPISYQSRDRKSTKSQEATLKFPTGNAIHVLDDQVPRGLASALFNSTDTLLNGITLYMVIGTGGDDNYVSPSYVTWTAVLGFGRVPKDNISLKVIIIIIVSLGIPGLLIFLGSFYVAYKKKPWQNIARGVRRIRGRDGYEQIN